MATDKRKGAGTMRLFLIASSLCAVGALVAASAGLGGQPVTQTLNPSPPSYYSCIAVRSGTIRGGNPPLVPYRQRNTSTYVLAVPGDLGSATETTTWEITAHLPGGGQPLLFNDGRTIFAPDGTTEFSAGHLDYADLFSGDSSGFARLCDAL